MAKEEKEKNEKRGIDQEVPVNQSASEENEPTKSNPTQSVSQTSNEQAATLCRAGNLN